MIARMPGAAAAFALVLVFALVNTAHAQRPDAEVAFERGRKLMAEGKYAAACAAFEDSLRLEQATGTLYNLGLCHEKLGKLASAWSELKQVATTASQNRARAADAASRVEAIEPRLVRWKLALPQPTPEGLIVERDGVDVTALADQAVPIDPGEYKFSASAPGYKPKTITVALDREGETVIVKIPRLAKAPNDDPTPTLSGDYARVLPLRPLTMPSGLAEVTAANAVSTSDSEFEQVPIDAAIAGRIGIQRFELGLRAAFHLRYAEVMATRPSPLSSVAGTIAFAWRPGFAARLEYARLHPIGDVGAGTNFRLAAAHKRLLGARVAFEGDIGLTFAQRDGGGGSASEAALESTLALQATAHRRVSVELAGRVQINLGGTLLDHTVALGVAPAALFSLAPQLDLFARVFVGLLPAVDGQSSNDLRIYTLGVSWRPLGNTAKQR
jgi:hypothetical protein